MLAGGQGGRREERCYHYESSNCRLARGGQAGPGMGWELGPLTLYKYYVTQGSHSQSKQSSAPIPTRGVRTDIPFSQIGDIYTLQSNTLNTINCDWKMLLSNVYDRHELPAGPSSLLGYLVQMSGGISSLLPSLNCYWVGIVNLPRLTN